MAQEGEPITAATLFLPFLAASDLEGEKAPIQFDLEWEFGSPIQSVTVEGQYAFVGRRKQLVIVDVSDPSQPKAVSESEPLESIIWHIAYADDHVFVTIGRGFHVFDVSDPANPIEVAAMGDMDAIRSVIVNGYAIISTGRNRLNVFNITDPANPRLVDTLTVKSEDLTVAGHHLFVVGGESGDGLRVFDACDPTKLREVGSVPIISAMLVEVSGEHAYVLADSAEGLVVIDVANPAQPRKVGQLGDWAYAYGIPGFAVSGGLAFIPYEGLRTIDVSDPSEPRRLRELEIETPGVVYDVEVVADRAYVADGGGGLRTLDIRDPSSIHEIGAFDSAGLAFDVVSSNDTAFIAAGHAGLRILDMANPTAPRQVALVDTPGKALDVTLERGHAYVADDTGGMRIIDVSEPAAAREVGFVESPDPIPQLVVASGHAFSNSDSGLKVFDLADSALPRTVGTLGTPPGVIAVEDGYLYLAAKKTLTVIDVHDPARPTIVGTASATESRNGVTPDGITIAGTYVFLAQGREGARVFDVSIPEDPRLAVQFRPPRSTAIDSRGPLVFTAAGSMVTVYDASLSDIPGKIAEVFFSDRLDDMLLSVHGEHLFLGGGQNGIAAYRISR